MNLTPPLALQTYTMEPSEIRDAEAGYCHRCPNPIEGRRAKRLVLRHEADGIKFMQCTRCKVIVVLAC